MYYYIFYRELIICGDFGTGGFYFRGMDGYLLSSGFYHPCGLFLPVCVFVLCLWFQSFHLCLTFTYIQICFDFSNFASSNFLFIYVYIDFFIYSLVFSTYMNICLIFIYFNLFCYYIYWLCPVVYVYSVNFTQNEDKLWDIFGRLWLLWYIICLYFSIFMFYFVGC